MNLEEQKKDYSKYMSELFRDCSMKAYELSLEKDINVEKRTNNMFEELSHVYNNNIAKSYLLKLNELYSDIENKVKNYPNIYWRTNHGKEDFRNGLKEFSKVKLEKTLQNFYQTNEMDEIDKEAICEYIEKTFELIKEVSFEEYFVPYIKNIGQVFIDIIQIQKNNKSNPKEITSLQDDALSLEIINAIKEIPINIKNFPHKDLKSTIKNEIGNIYSSINIKAKKDLKYIGIHN